MSTFLLGFFGGVIVRHLASHCMLRCRRARHRPAPPDDLETIKKIMASLPRPQDGQGGYFVGPAPVGRDL